MKRQIKGVVYMPTKFRRYVAQDRYRSFFSELKEQCGFETYFTDSAAITPDIDVVVTVKSPQHSNPHLIIDVDKLPKKTKLIGIFADLHSKNKVLYEKNMIKMLTRCDVILTQCYEWFEELYPDFLSKAELFANFFAPHEDYNDLPFNKDPINKCVLSGNTSAKYYPLRDLVRKKGDKKKIVHIKTPPDHPAPSVVKNYFIGARYAKLLNNHFCCIGVSGIYQNVVAKFVEIPATGSLLIANEARDSKRLGFIPGEHYISVNRKNILETIYTCLDNPAEYTEIRKNGMELARSKHSVKNRVEQFKQVLRRLL